MNGYSQIVYSQKYRKRDVITQMQLAMANCICIVSTMLQQHQRKYRVEVYLDNFPDEVSIWINSSNGLKAIKPTNSKAM